MTSYFTYAWAATPHRLAVAAGVTLAFVLLARALRGVNRAGAVAGGVSCFALFAGLGPVAFAALGALFTMTWASTRFRYRRKQELGVAERRDGRNASQVLANLAAPAAGALLFGMTGNRVWILAAMAALSEAATDTVASEIGQVGIGQGESGQRLREAFLITTWQRVPAGMDGGITIAGTVAGLAGGIAIALVARLGGILVEREMWITVAAGFAGMLADSLLGATVQRRGWIRNQGVNFVATLGAAALAYAMSLA